MVVTGGIPTSVPIRDIGMPIRWRRKALMMIGGGSIKRIPLAPIPVCGLFAAAQTDAHADAFDRQVTLGGDRPEIRATPPGSFHVDVHHLIERVGAFPRYFDDDANIRDRSFDVAGKGNIQRKRVHRDAP